VSLPEFSPLPPAEDDPRRWIAKPALYTGAHHGVFEADVMPEGADDGDMVYQEAVDGDLAAVVAFRDLDGELRYLGAQRTQRTYPEPHGVSVRARIVDVPPATAKEVELLLDRIGWYGVAELQFLVTPDRRWLLIDLNGRFFGSLALTAAAGADLPNAWLALATGDPVSLPREPGRVATYQWLEGDLRRAAARRDLREVGRALALAVRSRHSIWDARDPAPALRHGGRLLRSACRKVTRR
jgi:predicted ATP-grasp superfamily ATP-dependent carboligase